ncbi:MAG: hypothetical protein PXY39_06190 [archaeon]|nr:hypothetical protein [archaeon]
MGVRRRKSEPKSGSERKKGEDQRTSSSSFDKSHTAVVEEHGTEVLLIRSDLSREQFPDSIKESRYSRSFIQHQKRLEESQSNVTVDHLLKSSLDLDDTAKKKIEQVRAIGSKRFASDLIELLESASKAIEQNANLLKILRHHLGLGSHSSSPQRSEATPGDQNTSPTP